MRNALRHIRGESQKNIIRLIEGLSGRYNRWDIWQDFIIMSATAIANTMGGPQVKAREELYRSHAERYSAKELEVFADMLFEVVAEQVPVDPPAPAAPLEQPQPLAETKTGQLTLF